MRKLVAVLSFLAVQIFATFQIVYVVDKEKVLMFKETNEGVDILEATLNILPLLLSFDDVCLENEFEHLQMDTSETPYGKIAFSITDSRQLEDVMKQMRLYYEMINPTSKFGGFNYTSVNIDLMDELEKYEGLLRGKEIANLLGFAHNVSNYVLTHDDKEKIAEILRNYRKNPTDPKNEFALLNLFLKILTIAESVNSENIEIGNIVGGVRKLCGFYREVNRMLKAVECKKNSRCDVGSMKISKIENVEDLLVSAYAMITGLEADSDLLDDLKAELMYIKMILEKKLECMRLAWYDLKLIILRQLLELKKR